MSDFSAGGLLPHRALSLSRPDEVAECWDGVLKPLAEGGDAFDLYNALWRSLEGVKPLGDAFDLEDCGPHDVIGYASVASLWDRFTPAQQARLNELAESSIAAGAM